MSIKMSLQDDGMLLSDDSVCDDGSTLDPSETERQTDRGWDVYPADEYVSMRITIKHASWEHVRDNVLKGEEKYISYPHFGKNGNNEHFHVFVPGGARVAKKLRERCKKLNLFGNQQLSIKCLKNGILQAISYGAREGTEPFVHGSGVSEWVQRAPEWQHADLQKQLNPRGRGMPKEYEGIQITQRNFLKMTWKYRKDNNLHSDDLTDIWLHMFANGYDLAPAFAKGGMPTFYLDVFKEACTKDIHGREVGLNAGWRGTKFTWKSVVFRDPKF